MLPMPSVNASTLNLPTPLLRSLTQPNILPPQKKIYYCGCIILQKQIDISSPKTGCPDHPGFPGIHCQVEAQIEQEQHDAAMVRQRREMQGQIEAFTVGKALKKLKKMEDGMGFQHVMMQNLLDVWLFFVKSVTMFTTYGVSCLFETQSRCWMQWFHHTFQQCWAPPLHSTRWEAKLQDHIGKQSSLADEAKSYLHFEVTPGRITHSGEALLKWHNPLCKTCSCSRDCVSSHPFSTRLHQPWTPRHPERPGRCQKGAGASATADGLREGGSQGGKGLPIQVEIIDFCSSYVYLTWTIMDSLLPIRSHGRLLNSPSLLLTSRPLAAAALTASRAGPSRRSMWMIWISIKSDRFSSSSQLPTWNSLGKQ